MRKVLYGQFTKSQKFTLSTLTFPTNLKDTTAFLVGQLFHLSIKFDANHYARQEKMDQKIPWEIFILSNARYVMLDFKELSSHHGPTTHTKYDA